MLASERTDWEVTRTPGNDFVKDEVHLVRQRRVDALLASPMGAGE